MVLIVAPVKVSRAEINPEIDDVTQSLQTDYQSQLNRTRTNSKGKKATRKTEARSQAERDILAAYHQFITRSNPVKKKPVRRRTNPIPRPQSRPVPKPVSERPPIPDAEDLFDAASRGGVNTIARLLDEGININVGNAQKETALHMAAARGHYSTVIFLINNGANIYARTIKNWLSIHHATRFRHANIARYLMQKGLSPHYQTSDGYSSIDMARTNNDRPLLNVFGAAH